jgi:hypothetical protein
MSGLNAAGLIRITSSIAPQGLVRRETGRTLFLTTDDTIPMQERVRTYTDFQGASEDFAVGSAPYIAAQKYFSQEPFPRNLMVGRFSNSAVDTARIVGGVNTVTIEALAAITAGSFKVKVDEATGYSTRPSTVFSITGLDFHEAVSFADVELIIKTALETALDAVVDTVTVDLATSGCEITMVAKDPTKVLAVSFLEAGTTGSDIAVLLGMTIDTGKEVHYSTLVETVEAALDRIVEIDPSFTFVCEDAALSDTSTVSAISAWCQAQRVYILSCASHDANVKGTNTGTIFAALKTLEPSNTFGTYSEFEDYKHVSAAARLSSVNFNASNSLITLMYKILQGCTTDELTATEAQKIQEAGANYYSRRSGVAMYEIGQTFNPNYWIDTKYWMIWFENACLVELFNVLYSSKKLPQTEGGMSVLKSVLSRVCQAGVRNGGIAPGTLSAALTKDVQDTTGNSEFDGVLHDGYFIHSEPIAEQSQSERTQRRATPIKIWLKGSGAIQFAEAEIVFEQ